MGARGGGGERGGRDMHGDKRQQRVGWVWGGEIYNRDNGREEGLRKGQSKSIKF